MPDRPPLVGLHHVTIVARDAAATVDFYTRLLGLQFLKKTVNYDLPETYHLYFGAAGGASGGLVTAFVWPDAPDGVLGVGATQHFALAVSTGDALLKWKRYLTDKGIAVAGPYDHHAYQAIFFDDPAGVVVELATLEPGWSSLNVIDGWYTPPIRTMAPFRDEAAIARVTWPEPIAEIQPDMRLGALHHISPISSDLARTDEFVRHVLGMSLLLKAKDDDDPESKRWYWRFEGPESGTLTYYHVDSSRWDGSPPRAEIGVGIVHHFALATPNLDDLIQWREWLAQFDVGVTAIYDRTYFHSVYLRDPDGQMIEIATSGPGFRVDQASDRLGVDLALPPRLEFRRSEIEAKLPPLSSGTR